MPKLTETITDAVVRKLEAPAKGNVLYYDPELRGFTVRVTAAGAKAFLLVYHFGGVERRDTIGAWPAWNAKAAREVAKSWRRDVDLDVDPRGEPEPEDPENATFKARAEQYLVDPRRKRQKTPLRASTVREYRRALLTYAKPLHGEPLDPIRRRDIAELLDQVKAERGTVSAMRTRAALGRLYTWAIARGYAETNPVAGTEGWETPKRERELSDEELRLVWAATAEKSDYNLIVRMILWTGARPAEAGGMAWTELNGGGIWAFTADRAKNGRPLALPLPRQAQDALEARPRIEGRDALFGYGKNGFSGWSHAKAALDDRIARLNAERRLGRPLAENEEPAEEDHMGPWQLRDLRRSVETRLASIAVPQEIINRCLNHAQGPITTTYNRYEYLEEKRAALQKWADALDRITAPEGLGAEAANVIRLRRRSAS